MSRSRSIASSRTSSGIPRRTHSHRQNQKCPRTLVLVQGTFEPARIEAFIRERAGTMDEYKGRKILLRREDGHDIAVGLVGSDLIAMGQADLVRRVIDMSLDGSGPEKNIAANRRDDESHSRQCRQHGMGCRAVRRNQPPHAASQRDSRTSAPYPAGVGESQHQRGHQSCDSCGGRRRGRSQSVARRRPRLHLARQAAGRREAGAREPAEVYRAVGQRHDCAIIVRGVARNAACHHTVRAWPRKPRTRRAELRNLEPRTRTPPAPSTPNREP